MHNKYFSGILFALVFAVPAYFLGQEFPIIGGPVFGILLGILLPMLPRRRKSSERWMN